MKRHNSKQLSFTYSFGRNINKQNGRDNVLSFRERVSEKKKTADDELYRRIVSRMKHL